MQELLGRIARLDPSASLGLRVIACFDELVVGNVNTRALLSAAASLAGCVCGFEQSVPRRTVRVDPRGELVPGVATDTARTSAPVDDGLAVWLERDGPAMANDAIILERLALAVRIRHGRSRGDEDRTRSLAILLDPQRPDTIRATAASSLGLLPNGVHRVVVAPLFAVWATHPGGPEDVVPTRFGPLHVLVVPAAVDHVEASPAGIGSAVPTLQLHRSFAAAVTAVRLATPPSIPLVTADDYGGLVALLAGMPDDPGNVDADVLDSVLRHPWAPMTLEALLRTTSMRQAARELDVHHKTLQSRVDTLCQTLGWDPTDGHGRIRLGIAYLTSRLRRSRVLDLPPPSTS